MIYLIVFLVDPTVATENPELKGMPLWFNHATVTISSKCTAETLYEFLDTLNLICVSVRHYDRMRLVRN
ncbi:unnamed protein product [Trichobilharzia regenti]|nr:unnamed protein product [Trichobilharzia regenti]